VLKRSLIFLRHIFPPNLPKNSGEVYCNTPISVSYISDGCLSFCCKYVVDMNIKDRQGDGISLSIIYYILVYIICFKHILCGVL